MTWTDLSAGDPELAAAGVRLLTHTGTCAGFLSTVRRDGGPRVHPVYPYFSGGRLWVFIVDMSWKYSDLLRDPRIALHAFPTPEGGEEFYFDGEARAVTEPGERASVVAGLGRHRAPFEAPFELVPLRALWTKWEAWGTPEIRPSYRKWHRA